MAGYVKVYIVSPSMIHDIATGELVEQGIQKPYSVSIPLFVATALDRGRSGMAGAGKIVWTNVDIQEGKTSTITLLALMLEVNIVFKVADLYIVLYNSIVSNPATGHGREGIYFGENGEYNLYDVSKAIGEGLMAIGKVDDPEPTTFTKEEIDRYFQVSSHPESRVQHRSNIGIPGLKTRRHKLPCSGK